MVPSYVLLTCTAARSIDALGFVGSYTERCYVLQLRALYSNLMWNFISKTWMFLLGSMDKSKILGCN